MSTFGSPGGRNVISKPIPPERGSFPLDHDGECKSYMAAYITCIRQQRGVNREECRMLSKAYLQCRMDRNLMAPDSMKNLGFGSATENADQNTATTSADAKTQDASTNTTTETKS